MRYQLRHINLLLRIPFVFAALMLGGCLWWVTRRLYGNIGGYIALALYCFAPPVIAAAVYPNNEIWAAFGMFAAVYTAIGVSHAMQGPRRKWRPRIVLLTVILGFTASAHISAFVLALLLTVCFMAYLAEGSRGYLPTLLIVWVVGAMFILFASYTFRPDAFSYVFRSEAAKMGFSLEPSRTFFWTLSNAVLAIASAGALGLYTAIRRSRYFGNTAPLIVAVLLMLLITTGTPSTPSLWGIPFLLAFVAGVFADVLETRYRRWFFWIIGGLLLAEGALSIASLPILVR